MIARGADPSAGDLSALNLDRPEWVFELHRDDFEAGSDAVLTNTFGASRPWLESRGLGGRFEAINRAGARLARQAAGPNRLVFGSIGPTSARGGADSYREQADLLRESGVDALILETHDVQEAELGTKALAGRGRLLVSLAFLPEAFPDAVRRLVDLGADAIGLNCGRGLADVSEGIARLAGIGVPLIAKPSAGLPTGPRDGPEAFAGAVAGWLSAGVRYLGGCCGTDSAHVRALRTAVEASRNLG